MQILKDSISYTLKQKLRCGAQQSMVQPAFQGDALERFDLRLTFPREFLKGSKREKEYRGKSFVLYMTDSCSILNTTYSPP